MAATGQPREEGTMARIAERTPFREFDAIERRMRGMLEGLGFMSALLPAADVYETADAIVVELEVPGYDENELSIEISDGTLKVTGERTETKEEAKKTFRARGRLKRTFERRFDLPIEADTERITAVFEKGVLELHVPKRKKGETHKVAISKAGRSGRET
jgi:HSP20 family protein